MHLQGNERNEASSHPLEDSLEALEMVKVDSYHLFFSDLCT